MSRIIAKNVSIEFPIIGADRSFRKEILGGKVGGLFRRKGNKSGAIKSVQALTSLNLDLKNGDRLGLIGHNGAGKTTTLRMLLGNYWPTSGELKIEGHCIPLLSLGLGMDPDFSGVENIYLCGHLLGIEKHILDEHFQDICEFTELGDFLKLPIRTYSAGMLLRLSFAIITATSPDILLLDEVFGTGDASFYEKAQRRMNGILERTNILVFASHSNMLIRQQCNMVCVMEKGESIFVGDVEDGISFYEERISLAK